MNPPPQPAPPKPEPIDILLHLLVLIMVTIPITLCWIFSFGQLYGSIALAVHLSFNALLIWLLRRCRIAKSKTIAQIAETLGGKPSDDRRQMARSIS